MSTSNQQTLADLRANERPPMHEKGDYISWESRYLNHFKMTEGNKKQYIADVKVMNYLLQAIPNDIYNSVDAHSPLMDEFDKFVAKEGESLESMYERLTTLVNIMDHNNVHPIPMSINTKFLNCLQPEWRKYVTVYQGELQGDSQEDKITTAMLLLARAITQKFSTPTNNHLRYGGNSNRNAGRQNNNQAFNVGTGNDESNQIVHCVPRTESTLGKANGQCYNCVEKGHYARDCQKPRVRDAKYFREQMLLAMKDEAESNLKDEENDFMLDNSNGDETLEDHEVNASNMVHKQVNHVKRKTIIHTSNDDQIDSNIIFDDPYVENNGGTSEHDLNAHDEYHDIQMLAYNVQREAKAKRVATKELETFKNRVKTFK
ncbi:retrovirus-related pol polyprotein from transposon TNT 1-94 [Tanacetum coccineum]|uniref:Retrovirus-related pol polyprotein from transposon TNT 1-94 n=1 Tax=Tanacetum coccineum TaxID=301880 RepID=A0ABQ5CUC5_9ASTR